MSVPLGRHSPVANSCSDTAPPNMRAPANSGAPSVLIAYGENNAIALKQSGIRGVFVRPTVDEDIQND